MKDSTVFGFAFKCRKDLSLVTGKTRSREEKPRRRGEKARTRVESMAEDITLACLFQSQRLHDLRWGKGQ